jgi:dihydrofolate synthase/folylpolyglutamate synthase
VPLHGAHHAQNTAVALAAVEAFLGAGADTGVIDVEVVREALVGAARPAGSRWSGGAPTVIVDAAHNPHGMAASVAALGSRSRSGGWSAWSRCSATRTHRDAGAARAGARRDRRHENFLARRMSADDLAALAVPVFGADRVVVEPRLDDAIEAACSWPRRARTSSAAAGVLVTARSSPPARPHLLGAGRRSR